MWCIVNLPNGTQQAVKWDSKAIGQECLEKVCKALGIICETEYFGLEYWSPNQKETRTRQWINLRNRLTMDSTSSGIQLLLALRVKFWVPVHSILQESVRDLFFMQAKADLLNGRIRALNWKNSAKLSALLCQSDGLKFNVLSVKCRLMIASQNGTNQDKKQEDKKDHVLYLKKRRLSEQEIASHNCNNHTQPISSLIMSSESQNCPHPNGVSSTESPTSIGEKSTLGSLSFSSNSVNDSVKESPLHVYKDYIIQPFDENDVMPEDFLLQIAQEHSKLTTLKMLPKSAKYWLLQEIQVLPGYGEEVFSGSTTSESTSQKCDIAVGASGITYSTGDDKQHIPFSAITSAKSFRRNFKLEYVNDHIDQLELEVKLPKHIIAEGLYRSITERHAFYVCDKVRGVVTNQFTRDLKGTIASMFKEDTELGKRYVFDIQHTSREVHDQARRILHEKGILNDSKNSGIEKYSYNIEADLDNWSNLNSRESSLEKLDMAIQEKERREAAIERCVDLRISDAMTCKICMDRPINSMFQPCCHVTACLECATRCKSCPNCRVHILQAIKIFLPSELRSNLTQIQQL